MSAGDIRVLLVEDDPAILRFLRNTLRMQDPDPLASWSFTRAR